MAVDCAPVGAEARGSEAHDGSLFAASGAQLGPLPRLAGHGVSRCEPSRLIIAVSARHGLATSARHGLAAAVGAGHRRASDVPLDIEHSLATVVGAGRRRASDPPLAVEHGLAA